MKAIFNMKSETIIVSDIKLFSKKKTKFLEKSFRSIPSKKNKKKKQKKKKKRNKKKKKSYFKKVLVAYIKKKKKKKKKKKTETKIKNYVT